MLGLEIYMKVKNYVDQVIRSKKKKSEINLGRNNSKNLKKFFSSYKFNDEEKQKLVLLR